MHARELEMEVGEVRRELQRLRQCLLRTREIPGRLGHARDAAERSCGGRAVLHVEAALLEQRRQSGERFGVLAFARELERFGDRRRFGLAGTWAHPEAPISFIVYPANNVMPRLSSRGIGNNSTRLATNAPAIATGQEIQPAEARNAAHTRHTARPAAEPSSDLPNSRVRPYALPTSAAIASPRIVKPSAAAATGRGKISTAS